MRAAVLIAALAGAAVLLLPAPATGGRQKAYVLTAIANVGTVCWRYDCVHYEAPEWSLGIRWDDSATTTVRYRAGRIVRRRTLPSRGTLWFPFRKNVLQSLDFVQAIEPGTLRARVTVDWRGGRHCEPYFPPRVSMRLYPRG